MKDLSLNDLLRYGLAGGNFLVFFYWQFQPSFTINGEFTRSAAILGVSLLVGSVLYVVHRALPFPLLFLPISLRIAGFNEGVSVWDQKRSTTLEVDGVLKATSSEWGAQVHFLYVLFWSTVLVPFAGYIFTSLETTVRIWQVLLIAFVYLIAGIIHNVRLAKFTISRIEACA